VKPLSKQPIDKASYDLEGRDLDRHTQGPSGLMEALASVWGWTGGVSALGDRYLQGRDGPWPWRDGNALAFVSDTKRCLVMRKNAHHRKASFRIFLRLGRGTSRSNGGKHRAGRSAAAWTES